MTGGLRFRGRHGSPGGAPAGRAAGGSVLAAVTGGRLILAGYVAVALVSAYIITARASIGVPLGDVLAGAAAAGEVRPPMLAIVFQLEDCYRDGELLARWDVAGAPYRTVGIVLPGRHPKDVLRRAVARLGLGFPVVIMDGGAIGSTLRRMGFDSTPVVLAVDPAGRIRSASPLGAVTSPESFRFDEDL